MISLIRPRTPMNVTLIFFRFDKMQIILVPKENVRLQEALAES